MDLFRRMAELEHERVLFCSNPDAGLRAIIAVHSTVLGPGLGGVRMWPYENEERALEDVLRLSRGMTQKAAASGIDLGGAKAVIIGDPRRDKSEALFRAFGRFVDSLGGDYITAEDVGTSAADMEFIAVETPWVTGLAVDRGGAGDPSPVTALGVLEGIKAAARWRWKNESLEGRTISVQGLGSVGGYLVSYLAKEGARLVGCDIDAEAAERARRLHGVEIVAPDAIYDVECDIFAPCALGGILNETTIPRLKCAIVAGGANNQLDREDRDAATLEAREILYTPDFVINAGGLVNVYNEFVGYNRDRAMRMAKGIHDNVLRVFEIAAAGRISTAAAADRMAAERLAKIRALGVRQWDRAVRSRLSRSS